MRPRPCELLCVVDAGCGMEGDAVNLIKKTSRPQSRDGTDKVQYRGFQYRDWSSGTYLTMVFVLLIRGRNIVPEMQQGERFHRDVKSFKER